jgi:ribose transport system ATP-binding protein
VAETWVSRLGIRCSSIEQTAGNLSGGNQQKVVLARWLYRDCSVLICDEPTRGIDVGSKFEIYRLLDRLADEGRGIIVVSSDLKELLGLCDRIAVLSAGRLVKTFNRGEWTEDLIMAAAFSELKM